MAAVTLARRAALAGCARGRKDHACERYAGERQYSKQDERRQPAADPAGAQRSLVYGQGHCRAVSPNIGMVDCKGDARGCQC